MNQAQLYPHHSLYKMNTGGEIQSRQEYEEKGQSQAAKVEKAWRKKRQNMKEKTTVLWLEHEQLVTQPMQGRWANG